MNQYFYKISKKEKRERERKRGAKEKWESSFSKLRFLQFSPPIAFFNDEDIDLEELLQLEDYLDNEYASSSSEPFLATGTSSSEPSLAAGTDASLNYYASVAEPESSSSAPESAAIVAHQVYINIWQTYKEKLFFKHCLL